MAAVKTGAAVLAADGFRTLVGKKIGLVTNQTGVLPDKTPLIDALRRAEGVKLTALFGPEHGVRGDVPAGEHVAGGKDAKTGLPVYSLYGRTRVPTAAMLSGLDALVFDIQDIGCRSYTYLSTLGCVLEGGARHGVPVIVLDRPNPTGLLRMEGGAPESGFFSFIGKYATAYRHGMTLGELAGLINGAGWLPGNLKANLTVVRCEGLTRDAVAETAFDGLPWVRTSPNVPRLETALLYAATGIVGELDTVSIGIGTDFPFGAFGAPGLDGKALAGGLEKRGIDGFAVTPATWIPKKGVHANRECAGVRIQVANPKKAELCRLNFALMDALRSIAPSRSLFGASSPARMFDLSCGTDRVRKSYIKGGKLDDLWAAFQKRADSFSAVRKPYLLYT